MDLCNVWNHSTVQHHLKTAANHLGPLLYNEISIYIWFVCIFHILLLFLIVCNLYINIVLLKTTDRLASCPPNSSSSSSEK